MVGRCGDGDWGGGLVEGEANNTRVGGDFGEDSIMLILGMCGIYMTR